MRTPARALLVLLASSVVAFSPSASAQKKGAKKPASASAPAAAPAPPAAPPRLTVTLADLVDRRSSADFPPPGLEVGLKLEGEDAASVLSVATKVSKAEDDTGKDLLQGRFAPESDERWKESHGDGPPAPSCSLASPARKARSASLAGTVSVYMPARDPAATITVPKILASRDKPPVTSTALAREKIGLRVLSKEGLEKEKKAAAEKKKAEAAKKRKGKKTDGMQELGEAMGDALAQMFERVFMMAGENDLILEVKDPGKKVFSFGIAGPDGAPITTYGTTDIESYRIIRLLEPLPPGASLQLRLKTPRTFAELPFQLADVKLP